MTVEAIWARLDELAADVGRLRRRLQLEPESSAGFALNRIARHVETLDLMLRPSAGDLVRRGVDVDEALRQVDAHAGGRRLLLGLPEPCRGRTQLGPLTPDEQAAWDRLRAAALGLKAAA